MNDPKVPRFSLELPRMIITTIIYLGIGIWGVNTVSGRKILECDRLSGVVQCHLITKQLLTAARVTAFDRAKLQKAIVGEHQGARKIVQYVTVYTIDLVTDQGTFSLTTNEMAHAEKYRLVASINAFLANPQIPKLKVEEGYSNFFGIGIGIFSFVLALLGFGWAIFWQFPADIADKTVNEILQESWEATLEPSESKHRQEYKTFPNSNAKKAPNLK
jgi:hypothetical protein